MQMKTKIVSSALVLGAFAVSAQQKVIINLDKTFQEIEGFAASDCWTVNYVGQWAGNGPENAAKWLFSSSFKTNGDPTGIGLSMWRVNLGAGTAEQGDASTITDISRRAECFMNADGSYDWSKQKGQQFFCEKALEYGCNNFVLFSNSPLVYFTRNGLGTSPGDWKSNLKPEYYADFADYLTEVTDYFINRKGMNVSYVSPVNEPQYQWTGGGQEGSPWTNAEIKKLVMELDKSILTKKLPVKILITEAGDWSRLLQGLGHADSQIFNFWDKLSVNYLGDIQTLDKTVGAHSYWLDRDNETLQNVRENVNRRAKEYGLKSYQTEWSMLSDPPTDQFPASYEEASYTDIALHMAKVIHSDLVYANVASWSFWTSMDMERWGHKNRFSLLKLIPGDGDNGSILNSGKVTTHKTLWALGNYSLFIRPGYKRVEMSGANELSALMGSAYVSPNKDTLVTVYVNVSQEKITIQPDLSGLSVKERCMYRTCSLMDLKYIPNLGEYKLRESLVIPPRSIITVSYILGSISETKIDNRIEFGKNQIRLFPNPVYGDKIYFEHKDIVQTPERVTLFATNGQFLGNLKFDVCGNSIKLPSDLQKGLYIIRFERGGEHYYQHMIKKEKV